MHETVPNDFKVSIFLFTKTKVFMSCARLNYLQCLKLIIKTTCYQSCLVNFSPSRFNFRKRKKKIKKEKDIITWKQSTQSCV